MWSLENFEFIYRSYWVPGFVELIKEIQHITFSNVGWGFGADCIGLIVSAWLPMVMTMGVDAEYRVGIGLHQLAIRLKDKVGLQSVFAAWDLLGNNHHRMW